MDRQTETKTTPIQFVEFLRHAGDFFDQVASGENLTIKRGDTLLRLSAVRAIKRTPISLSASDALFGLVSLGAAHDPSNDASMNKHKYLADASMDLHAESTDSNGSSDQPDGQ